MFDLKQASQGIRKHAALNSIWSGKVELVFSEDDPQLVAIIYNKNFPDGYQVYNFDAENALDYTWREIKELGSFKKAVRNHPLL